MRDRMTDKMANIMTYRIADRMKEGMTDKRTFRMISE